MKIQRTEVDIIITLNKNADNILYKWLKTNTEQILIEAFKKTALLDSVSESLTALLSTNGVPVKESKNLPLPTYNDGDREELKPEEIENKLKDMF